MTYVVKNPSGQILQETPELLDALDTMRAAGKGATVTTAEGVKLATNVGPFNMFVGRDEAVHQRLSPWVAVNCMPQAAFS